ncbi:hypothetical protein [Roseivivax sp. CAU 1761]
MKAILLMAAASLVLSACGGGSDRVTRGAGYYAPVTRFASGPISRACLASDRKARNTQLCGCLQGVANASLSGAEQRAAERFFRDPHEAQVMRQSDRPDDERTWRNYKAFVGRAEQICRGL